jgi:hypothetical protein
MADGRTARVRLVADWWGGSEADLQAEITSALEAIGARRDAETPAFRLDVAAQQRLRREAQMIRNRARLRSNVETVATMTAHVRDVHGSVLRTRSAIRRARAVAHVA